MKLMELHADDDAVGLQVCILSDIDIEVRYLCTLFYMQIDDPSM